MSAREFAAGMSPALDNLPRLPADHNHAQRVAVLEARVEDLLGALAKIRDLAAAGGSAPGSLALVAEVADQALRGAR